MVEEIFCVAELHFTIVAYRPATKRRPRNTEFPIETSSHATVEGLLETVFPAQSVSRCYNEDTPRAADSCKVVCEAKTWRLVWDGRQPES
jgi:hypothetical protein